ncbi:FecR family protein [Mucilaginibacter kameinonensis]|uniref:FecR family protein n=1 Tax=Mucilaginibacter kameinonensis TaxID=452286 RepID=UPI000EF79DA9|nr:FecR domain-containing protein [Mucilaginibacter kameinonensis]
MDKNYLQDLLKRYDEGNASEQEKAIVESWYLSFQSEKPSPEIDEEFLRQLQQQSITSLTEHVRGNNKVRKIHRGRFLIAAASVTIALVVGAYKFVNFNNEKRSTAVPQTASAELLPGSNKVTLTLSNGNKVVLSGAKNGQVARDAGTAINKTADGSIAYSSEAGGHQSDEPLFNTATTPRGGQYQFTLSDGTKVWLNAATTFKFPVQFNGTERRVELTGEAYFEVAHDKNKPFRVVSNGQVIEVLGTHFNVNSYADERVISTTLLEGSVKISHNGASKVIKPGEQARLSADKLDVVKVNTDQAIAWKNGMFYFHDANMYDVMRQLSRWYDVDVKFDGSIPDRKFSGGISRNVNAAQLLDLLTFKKINYKIQGRTIVITP